MGELFIREITLSKGQKSQSKTYRPRITPQKLCDMTTLWPSYDKYLSRSNRPRKTTRTLRTMMPSTTRRQYSRMDSGKSRLSNDRSRLFLSPSHISKGVQGLRNTRKICLACRRLLPARFRVVIRPHRWDRFRQQQVSSNSVETSSPMLMCLRICSQIQVLTMLRVPRCFTKIPTL